MVTQPHFLAERGDDYLRDVEAGDLPWLYRARGWLEAGVRLAGGSDAPFGAPDPWRAIRAAVARPHARRRAARPSERLAPERALALFLAPLDDPGGPPRRVAVGAPADLCLLDRPWRDAREPSSDACARPGAPAASSTSRKPRSASQRFTGVYFRVRGAD